MSAFEGAGQVVLSLLGVLLLVLGGRAEGADGLEFSKGVRLLVQARPAGGEEKGRATIFRASVAAVADTCRQGTAWAASPRVRSTRAVGEAIARAARPPNVWLQAGTATTYAHRYDAPNDDVSGVLGGAEPDLPDTWRFSLDVAHRWEAAQEEAATPHTRKTILRSAMVMSVDRGGVFDTLLGLAQRGLGGQDGDGRQLLSWIHGDDFVRAVRFLLGDGGLAGPVNLAAPNPLPNAAFLRALRDAAGVRVGLPATEWMLEIGARALGTETELILKSRYVIPRRLTEAGFTFEYPDWPQAAQDLCRRARVPAVKPQ